MEWVSIIFTFAGNNQNTVNRDWRIVFVIVKVHT